MNFYKKLTGWSWFETLFLIAVIFMDNFSVNHDGLWLSLILVVLIAVSSLHDEMIYDFKLPVNHPDQPFDEREILANLVRSVLAIIMCFASVRFSSPWLSVLAAGLMAVASYATYKSYMLYLFTKGDVKYAG